VITRIADGIFQGDSDDIKKVVDLDCADLVVCAAKGLERPNTTYRCKEAIKIGLEDNWIDWEKEIALSFFIKETAMKVAVSSNKHMVSFIYCNAGLNRSSLITAMALRYLGHSANSAIDTVKLYRGPMALSNGSFVKFVRETKI